MTIVKPNVRISYMRREYMPDVLKIEAEVFGLAAWTEDKFVEVFKDDSLGMVAQHEGFVLGYMVYHQAKDSQHEIINLAVGRDFRRMGIGRRMVERLMHKKSDRKIVSCVQSEWCTESHLFLRACKFQATDVIRKFFEDGSDAYVFARRRHVEQD